MKKRKSTVIHLLIISLLLFLSGFLMGMLLPLKIIPLKYLIPFLILYFLILMMIITNSLFINKYKKLKKGMLVLSLLFILLLGMSLYYLNTTLNFMNKIQAKEYQIEEYYILVLKESNYYNLSDIKNKTLATYSNKNLKYQAILEEIKTTITKEEQEYINFEKASKALLEKETESLLISSTDKMTLEKEESNFENEVRILKKEQVKITTNLEKKEKDITKESFNIYISGIDISGNISLVSRSDVNMIITVNPITNQILLTSIPRDYYVKLHGTTGYRDKLTHAGIYGINMSIQTLEDLLGIEINYYVRINFTTLINLVDAIDGVDIYSDASFKAWTDPNCSYQVGTMHLNGKCALAYARERHAYQEGDRHRIQNQQDIVKAILTKTLSSKTFITKYTKILETLRDSFQTNIPTEKIYQLVNKQLDTMPNWTIEQIYLNGFDSSNYTYSYPGQLLYVMEPEVSTIDKAKQKIIEVENLE